MGVDDTPARPVAGDPIEVYLTHIEHWLRRLSNRSDPPAGIAALRVKPQTYPRQPHIDADTWVNLGIATSDDGRPYIAYETQWRKGDPIERLPSGLYPAFNFHG